MIADADVIRDKVEFKNIIDGIADEDIAKAIMDEREAVYSYFQKQNKYEILEQLRNKTQEFASQSIPSSEDNPQTIASALFDSEKGLTNFERIQMNYLTLRNMGVKHLKMIK